MQQSLSKDPELCVDVFSNNLSSFSKEPEVYVDVFSSRLW